MNNDRPGSELPKDARKIALVLVDEQGWTYRLGKKHPMLFPADKTQSPVVIAGSPSDHRAFKNFVAQVRRSGGKV